MSRPSDRPPFWGRRMIVVAGLGVFLAGPAQSSGVSVFVDPMREHFGWSRSFVSTAYAIANLLTAMAVVLSGRLLDRWGHRAVLTGTAIGFGLALLAMSAVRGPISLVIGFTTLRGLGIGALLLTCRTLPSQWYVRGRGRALSFVALGGSLSLALVPLTNELLIQHYGWQTTWRLNALVVWACLVPVAALVVRNRPEAIGQYPDGDPVPVPQAAGAAAPGVTLTWSPGAAARTRVFWILLGASVVPGLVSTGLDFNQVSIFTAQGLSATIAASVFIVSSAVWLVASFVAGALVDRAPPRYVLVAGQVLLGVAMLTLTFADTVPLALLYAAAYGAGRGVWAVAIDATWPAYFGRDRLGSIRGMTFAVETVGAAIGPIPFGLVYDAVGEYDPTIYGLLVLPVLAAGALLAATPPGQQGDDSSKRAAAVGA